MEQTALEPVQLRRDLNVFDAKARGWRELVYESHEANVVVPCASMGPRGPTVVIEPEAVHRLLHRPVIGFEPDAAAGE